MRGSIMFVLSLAAAIATPSLADEGDVRAADQRVERTAAELIKARASGDAVTIADARSRNDAARAVAWGRRHPAKQPTVTAAPGRR